MDTMFSPQPNAAQPNAALAGDADIIKNGDTRSFAKDVIEASAKVPVIVDFWATWCGPCKTLGPQLEKAVRAARGAVRLVKIDVDRNQDLAQQLRIQSIPAVFAFVDGRPADGFVGAVPESQINAFVARLVSGAGGEPNAEEELKEALQAAKEMIDGGDIQTASDIYRQILEHIPDEPSASAGLAKCLIALGDIEQAQQVIAALSGDALKNPDVIAVKATLELAAQSAKSGPAAELAQRVAEKPDDHQARFDLAMAYFGAGDRESAVDELLEIVKRNRAWNEEAARKQLIKLFEAFGPADPLTVQTRKRLSSLLFS
jgi:putative thioredoxin